MDWSSIIGAGIQAGGSLLGGMMGASGQSATNAQQMAWSQQMNEINQNYNSQEAARNRDWQQMMSSTAYQRQMQDMRAAGLNPILAAGSLGGASSPGGAAGSIGSPSVSLGNPGASTQLGITAAAGAARTAAELDVAKNVAKKDETQATLNKATEAATKENEQLTKQLNTKAQQDTATSAAQQHNVEATTLNTNQGTVNLGIDAIIKSHDANTAFQKSRLAQAEADQAIKHGPGPGGQIGGTAEKWIGRLVDTFRNPGGNAANAITSPTDPRWWGFKGRDSISQPGEGLVIDMKRK